MTQRNIIRGSSHLVRFCLCPWSRSTMCNSTWIPAGHYKLAFSGCGVTNGFWGVIYAVGLKVASRQPKKALMRRRAYEICELQECTTHSHTRAIREQLPPPGGGELELKPRSELSSSGSPLPVWGTQGFAERKYLGRNPICPQPTDYVPCHGEAAYETV